MQKDLTNCFDGNFPSTLEAPTNTIAGARSLGKDYLLAYLHNVNNTKLRIKNNILIQEKINTQVIIINFSQLVHNNYSILFVAGDHLLIQSYQHYKLAI